MERSAGDDKFSRDRENDYTQLSNYSPQDSPTQAPTRRHYDDHHEGGHQHEQQQPYRYERRQGSIDADSVGGMGVSKTTTGSGGVSSSKGRSIAQMIERRWKGRQAEYKRKQEEKQLQQQQEEGQEQLKLQRPPFLSRPSMEPEPRSESLVERIEAASQNMIRRSSANADLLIDKLSDALNAWSTGIDSTPMPMENQNKENKTDEGQYQSMNSTKKNKGGREQQYNEDDEEAHEEIPLNDDDNPKRPAASVISQDRRSWASLSFLFNSSNQNPLDENEQDNQQKQLHPQEEDTRRLSWSERAFSFLFNRPLFSSSPNRKTDEWGNQKDVEVQGSDAAYDDIQGSFKFWSLSGATPFSSESASPPSSTTAMVPSSSKEATATTSKKSPRKKRSNSHQPNSYNHDFPSPPKVRMRNESLPSGKQAVHHAEIIPSSGAGAIEQWPTESYARAARRSMTNGHGGKEQQQSSHSQQQNEEEEKWFDSDPESGRVKVPPLSMPRAPSNETGASRSQSLYDSLPSVTITPTKSTRDKMRNRKKKNNKEKNKYHVVQHKKHPEEDQGIPDREPRFDSDFENWTMTPESDTSSKRPKGPWPDSYQIKDENKHTKNSNTNNNNTSISRMKSVWVAQADAMH
ncbi:hypothetical protein BDA99DRAFT_560034 [Phascolomyces articulosus]|uniref:Uncharacterized protein n=1 Tax=Phascolomyces articulosus TaxID=60185 RepID=A0AAD5JZQ9_9FUNG|nr:hypothetical protein BDA99DRAFT_560034 [Phascolomyces articulosus]